MPDSMRCRLCSRLRLSANVRTASDYAGTFGYDDTVGTGAVRIHPFFLFDHPVFDGFALDHSLIDQPVLHVAHAVAAKDDDVNDYDRARDDSFGDDGTRRGCAFDDAAAAGRPVGRTEGSHDRPF
jgi:hypothetical protein